MTNFVVSDIRNIYKEEERKDNREGLQCISIQVIQVIQVIVTVESQHFANRPNG